MNRDQANDLVQRTFTKAFSKNDFTYFSKNLLNHLDESKAAAWNSQNIKSAFRDHVRRYERIGTYSSPEQDEIDILIVHLTDEAKLERARTAIRNFVADHLSSCDERNAALVAFVAPAVGSWRFSYVKMEYEAVLMDSGKVGVATHLTPARRFSYIVGEGEGCHTAQSRFLELLQATDVDPNLADIEEAFSVESVTREFFTKYTGLFQEIHDYLKTLIASDNALRNEFKEKSIDIVDFAKKLLGQIVFLYFVQKKGWLGPARGQNWGDGPRDFLRRLSNGEHGGYGNFFNEILEPLFYDTLASDRGHEAWSPKFKCRIPFLNGGLFEPLGGYDWRNIDVNLPNELFANLEPAEDGVVGTGVLDVFDRFNFTVNEAEPLEKEVAIDPEMLGKVFENLIEENRRKGLGAFYTPREIVHYMCQESIITYLYNSSNMSGDSLGPALPQQSNDIGKTDPKQSSFDAASREELISRGDIETLVKLGDQISHYESVTASYSIKMPKSIEEHARLIDRKLAEITVCDPAVGSGAFPVGLMTEIVRARSALTPYFNDVRERTPYHFKRHAIQNCLYGVDIDAGAVDIAKLRLWLSLVVDEVDVKQIKPLPNLEFKIVPGDSLLGFAFQSQRLQDLEELKQTFFDESDIQKRAELKELIDAKLNESISASRRSLGYEVNFDFETWFSEVFRKKGGFDIVIANPPYVDSELMVRSNPEWRKLLSKLYETTRGNWDLYIPFWELAINKANSLGTATLITPNKWLSIGYGKALRKFVRPFVCQISDYSKSRAFENVGVFPIVTLVAKAGQQDLRVRRFLAGQTLVFEQVIPMSLLNKFEKWGVFLSPHFPLILKLISGNPELSTLCKAEAPFTVSEAYELTKYIEEETAEKEGNLKFVNTGTIDPYITLWGHKKTTYLKTKYTKPVVKALKLEKYFPRRYVQSTSPKIIISGIRYFESFFDKEGNFIAGKSTVILRDFGKETIPEFLLGVLNSRLVRSSFESATEASLWMVVSISPQAMYQKSPFQMPSKNLVTQLSAL